jgi:hypothetical protein
MVRDLFPVRDIPVFFVNASRWLIANAGAYRRDTLQQLMAGIWFSILMFIEL